jgi:hypothetical protein
VANAEKIWMPLGMPMSMLAIVKTLRPRMGRPVVNMWWTHSPKLMMPMATSEMTSSE